MKLPFKNLVFSGGGVWGLAYSGVASVLTEQGIYGQIERVAGVSVGAIFATLISVGYDAKDIESIVHSTDFAKFEDQPSLIRVATSYGYFKGEFFLSWMRDLVARSPVGKGRADLTFAQLKADGGRDLYAFATDLNTQTFIEFSVRATPDVKIVEAVRASMSLPFVFPGWKFPGGVPTSHIYCDGGMMNNFPITFFDQPPFITAEELTNEATLGFTFMAPKADAMRPDDGLTYGEVELYLKALMESIIIGVAMDLQVPSTMRRTVMVDAHGTGISTVGFKIDNAGVKKLVDVGRDSLTAFIKNYENSEKPQKR